MKVIVINGFGGAGKDELVKMCQKIRPNQIYNVSMVDAVKSRARSFGWNGQKTEAGRRFLSDLKDAWADFNDGPYDIVHWRIQSIKELEEMRRGSTKGIIVFVHVREPYDIERFVKDFNAFTILVRRPGVGPINSNHADTNVESWNYNLIYDNEGDLTDMESEARTILNYIDSLDNYEMPEEK